MTSQLVSPGFGNQSPGGVSGPGFSGGSSSGGGGSSSSGGGGSGGGGSSSQNNQNNQSSIYNMSTKYGPAYTDASGQIHYQNNQSNIPNRSNQSNQSNALNQSFDTSHGGHGGPSNSGQPNRLVDLNQNIPIGETGIGLSLSNPIGYRDTASEDLRQSVIRGLGAGISREAISSSLGETLNPRDEFGRSAAASSYYTDVAGKIYTPGEAAISNINFLTSQQENKNQRTSLLNQGYVGMSTPTGEVFTKDIIEPIDYGNLMSIKSSGTNNDFLSIQGGTVSEFSSFSAKERLFGVAGFFSNPFGYFNANIAEGTSQGGTSYNIINKQVNPLASIGGDYIKSIGLKINTEKTYARENPLTLMTEQVNYNPNIIEKVGGNIIEGVGGFIGDFSTIKGTAQNIGEAGLFYGGGEILTAGLGFTTGVSKFYTLGGFGIYAAKEGLQNRNPSQAIEGGLTGIGTAYAFEYGIKGIKAGKNFVYSNKITDVNVVVSSLPFEGKGDEADIYSLSIVKKSASLPGAEFYEIRTLSAGKENVYISYQNTPKILGSENLAKAFGLKSEAKSLNVNYDLNLKESRASAKVEQGKIIPDIILGERGRAQGGINIPEIFIEGEIVKPSRNENFILNQKDVGFFRGLQGADQTAFITLKGEGIKDVRGISGIKTGTEGDVLASLSYFQGTSVRDYPYYSLVRGGKEYPVNFLKGGGIKSKEIFSYKQPNRFFDDEFINLEKNIYYKEAPSRIVSKGKSQVSFISQSVGKPSIEFGLIPEGVSLSYQKLLGNKIESNAVGDFLNQGTFKKTDVSSSFPQTKVDVIESVSRQRQSQPGKTRFLGTFELESGLKVNIGYKPKAQVNIKGRTVFESVLEEGGKNINRGQLTKNIGIAKSITGIPADLLQANLAKEAGLKTVSNLESSLSKSESILAPLENTKLMSPLRINKNRENKSQLQSFSYPQVALNFTNQETRTSATKQLSLQKTGLIQLPKSGIESLTLPISGTRQDLIPAIALIQVPLQKQVQLQQQRQLLKLQNVPVFNPLNINTPFTPFPDITPGGPGPGGGGFFFPPLDFGGISFGKNEKGKSKRRFTKTLLQIEGPSFGFNVKSSKSMFGGAFSGLEAGRTKGKITKRKNNIFSSFKLNKKLDKLIGLKNINKNKEKNKERRVKNKNE